MAALPPGVSLAAAEAILFTGKAVRVLKQPMSAAASHQALRAHGEVLGFAAALQGLQAAEAFRPADFELAVETMRAKVGGRAPLPPCRLHGAAALLGGLQRGSALHLLLLLLRRWRGCCGSWSGTAAT